ncbi:MAG: ATP-binding protein, partial [Chthoniobacterales bacterium]
HVGVDGGFLRVNDKLSEITGYPHAELLQITFLELTLPEDRAESDDARRAMLAGTQAVYVAEKRYRRKDGRIVWVNVVTTPLRDSTGAPKYFISVFSDVTERKLLQEQFLRAQRMESIGTLAGGIAHDLNNLLTPIVMGIGLLRRENSDPANEPLFDTMEKSAQRGTNLVKQVLSFARGIEGSRVTIHLSHLIREIQDFVQSTFPKNIRFAASVPKDTWLVHGDPTQLNQVLLNLCVNARDAMPQGGSLRLTARNLNVDEPYSTMLRTVPAGRYILLEVADTGCGIPAGVRDRIFEPFFTTKEIGKGTGLGLSTALGIVKSHGGFMRVYSEPGKGTTFRIYLPAHTEFSGELPNSREDEMPRGNGELILVVDDEPSVRQISQMTLEAFGYRVIVASDGAEAIAVYATRSNEVAAVITDVMMPGVDGIAAIQVLLRMNPNLPIIAASGLTTDSQSARATQVGVKYFLPKPCTAGKMLQMLRDIFTT